MVIVVAVIARWSADQTGEAAKSGARSPRQNNLIARQNLPVEDETKRRRYDQNAYHPANGDTRRRRVSAISRSIQKRWMNWTPASSPHWLIRKATRWNASRQNRWRVSRVSLAVGSCGLGGSAIVGRFGLGSCLGRFGANGSRNDPISESCRGPDRWSGQRLTDGTHLSQQRTRGGGLLQQSLRGETSIIRPAGRIFPQPIDQVFKFRNVHAVLAEGYHLPHKAIARRRKSVFGGDDYGDHRHQRRVVTATYSQASRNSAMLAMIRRRLASACGLP